MMEPLNKAVGDALNGLQTSPMLLALISLNIIMVGGALWFLKTLAAAQSARFDTLLKICGGKL
jgi:hypothetical protein